MKKLTLVALKQDARRITEKLMWLGCVEVEANREGKEEIASLSDVERQNAINDIKLLEDTCAVLIKLGNTKHGIFAPPPTVSKAEFESKSTGKRQYSEILEDARRILEQKTVLDTLIAEINDTESRIASLSPFLPYDAPLSITETKNTEIILGTLSRGADIEKLTEAIKKEGAFSSINKVSSDDLYLYVSVIFEKATRDTALKILSANGFIATTFPSVSDTPSLSISRLKSRSKELLSDVERVKGSLNGYAVLFDELQIALDIAGTALRLSEARRKLFNTDKAVLLSGFIPAEHTPALEKALKKEPVYLTLEDPEKNDDVPVRLVNSRPATYFESVVEMYSPPAYGSFDPTRIMMIFFFIIFGLMLADVVYGIILSLGSLFLIKKTNVSAGVKRMCGLFAYCGISCIIFGFLFGSYLGDLPARFMLKFFGIDIKVWSALDIMTEAIVFLILSLVLGALHMLSGMGIRFYVLWKSGERLSAIFDEGSWFLLFSGIGLYFIAPVIGITVAAIGTTLLILTQGRREKNVFMRAIKGVGSLYRIVSYASDLLSYSRIMALGLSSAVVASVFNILATMGGPTVSGVIMLVLIIPLGHLLNLAINLLGAFVHTSRLQYVEFFGKFFEDGGRPFKPLIPQTTHSVVTDLASKNDTE